MTWARGRDEVKRLIDDGEIEIVEASTEVADRLLRDAEAHVRLAALGLENDPAGALQLSYDAARKASAALLAVQGLRATSRGEHIAVIAEDPDKFSRHFRAIGPRPSATVGDEGAHETFILNRQDLGR